MNKLVLIVSFLISANAFADKQPGGGSSQSRPCILDPASKYPVQCSPVGPDCPEVNQVCFVKVNADQNGPCGVYCGSTAKPGYKPFLVAPAPIVP